MASRTTREIVERYNAKTSVAEASTPPAEWYLDPRMLEIERRTVFAGSWQMVGRVAQLADPGQYITGEVAGEPILVVRAFDRVVRGFFNVCRHHAAAVATAPAGSCQILRCPYHGWTYNLNGDLIGAPDFTGVRDFDRADYGLVSIETGVWQDWLFVNVAPGGFTLDGFLGKDLRERVRSLGLEKLQWFERRRYTLECNWKVFVDNYLDGGYHVPHVHGALHSVLDYSNYSIGCGERYCLQSSPIADSGDARTREVRRGERAYYYWIYPNFMINCYEGMMDTNLVCPRGVDRTEVIFDYYFADVSPEREEHNRNSIALSERIQDEDAAICNSVQRGLRSRAYGVGRLSARREAGEHLFHRLLYADLKSAAE
jgi:choline monooxygenase